MSVRAPKPPATAAASAKAGTTPIRSPRRPITAICTVPATPATRLMLTATAFPPDIGAMLNASVRLAPVTEAGAPRPVSPDELELERIAYEKTPTRATITLNRPEVLNAFAFRMLRELARACED